MAVAVQVDHLDIGCPRGGQALREDLPHRTRPPPEDVAVDLGRTLEYTVGEDQVHSAIVVDVPRRHGCGAPGEHGMVRSGGAEAVRSLEEDHAVRQGPGVAVAREDQVDVGVVVQIDHLDIGGALGGELQVRFVGPAVDGAPVQDAVDGVVIHGLLELGEDHVPVAVPVDVFEDDVRGTRRVEPMIG